MVVSRVFAKKKWTDPKAFIDDVIQPVAMEGG
jgi:hypothetical protein